MKILNNIKQPILIIILLMITFSSLNCFVKWERLYKGLSLDYNDPKLDIVYNIFTDNNDTNTVYGFIGNTIYKLNKNNDSFVIVKNDYNYQGKLLINGLNSIYKYGLEGLFESIDTAKTFIKKKILVDKKNIYREVGEINYLHIKNNTIYVGTDLGPYYSTDDGLTWNNFIVLDDTNLAHPGVLEKYLLSVSPVSSMLFLNDTIFYSCWAKGIVISYDGGKTWKLSNKGLDTSVDVEYNIYYSDNQIYLISYGIHNAQLYRSSDNGYSWIKLSDNITNLLSADYLFCGSRIYYHISLDSCLYYTDDYFITTNKICFNLNKFGVYMLSIIGDSFYISLTDIIYEGARGTYLYRAKLKDCELDTTSTEVIELPNPIRSGQFIYPNPASDYIIITLPSDAHTLKGVVEVRLYDVFGQEATLVSIADTPAGGGQIRVDVSALPAGVYFVRVGAQVNKFLKI